MESKAGLRLKRLTVYTCLFGDYQGLVEPREAWADCDFVCFTDRSNVDSNVWTVKTLKLSDSNRVRASRRPKILPHYYLEHSIPSLYVDANIRIEKNPVTHLLPLLDKASFWAPRHFARDCIYDEAHECVVLGRASVSAVTSEMTRYRALNIPPHAGLSENNVLLRAHGDPRVMDLMERWWSLYEQGCGRDQLSLPVAVMQSGFSMSYLDTSSRDMSDAAIVRHEQHGRDQNPSLWRRVKQKWAITRRRIAYRTLSF